MNLSRGTYQIEYKDTKIRVDQILSVLNEIARQMDHARKESLSKVEWIPKKAVDFGQMPQLGADETIFELSVPAESAGGLNVSKEILRIIPIRGNTVQVAITDASVSPSECEKMAIDFAKRLHEKATGRKISEEQISLWNIASLATNICEHCLQNIEGLPRTCKVCGRTFCYDHRRPETHGCQLKVRSDHPEETVKRHQQLKAEQQSDQPRVTIRRIPCG
jgi:hypothetical protein